jgi:hypothetical protein
MATACFRLATFLPLPDLSVPLLCSFMTLWILRLPLALMLEFECDDFVAIFSFPCGRRGRSRFN